MCEHHEQNTCVKSIQQLINPCVPKAHMEMFNVLSDFIQNINSQYCKSNEHQRTSLLNGTFTADGQTCNTKSLQRVSRLICTHTTHDGILYFRHLIVHNH